MVAVGQQVLQQPDVLGVAADEAIAGIGLAGLTQFAVLGEVVQPDDVMALGQQLLDQVAADEAGGPGDQNLHRLSLPRKSKTSMTGFAMARPR